MSNPNLIDSFGDGINSDNPLTEDYDFFLEHSFLLNQPLPKCKDIDNILLKVNNFNNKEELKTVPTQKEQEEIPLINNNSNNSCIILNNENIIISDKKNLAPKKRNSKLKVHDKYCSDNIFRKINSSLISNLISFINGQIIKVYQGKIGHGTLKKEFKPLKNQIKNVKDNKELINKKLKDIFCLDISERFSNYSKNHNKRLISILLNEKDEEKKSIFQNLFNLTFSECLDHLAGKNNIKELEGLKGFKEVLKKNEDEPDYLNLFLYTVENYEKLLLNKQIRKRRKMK